MTHTTILPSSSSSLAPNVPYSQTTEARSQLTNITELEGVPNLTPMGYDCIRYMGICNGGHIYLGKKRSPSHDSSRFVAIKKFCVDDIDDYQAIAKESAHMRSLQHDNILTLIECLVHERYIYQFTPAMNLGSLFDIVFEYKKWGLNERAIAAITHQVLNALNYLHERRFIHRDVKTRHILIDSHGNVKLTGFRFMVELNHHLDCVFDFDSSLHNQIYYLAPEVLKQNMHGYTCKSDIYMLGISICEAINGVMPFGELHPMEMLLRKLNGQVPRPVDKLSLADDEDMGIDISQRPQDHLNRQFSDEMHEFIARCLHFDPNQRNTAADCKLTPWLGSAEFAKLTPGDVKDGLELDYSHFELSKWAHEPVLPAEPEQRYEIVFDYSSIS